MAPLGGALISHRLIMGNTFKLSSSVHESIIQIQKKKNYLQHPWDGL